MIKINTTHIKDMPMPVNGTESAEILELPEQGEIHPDGEIVYDLLATMTGHDLLVTGKVRLSIETECAKCLDTFRTEVAVNDVCHLFEGAAEKEIDISPEIREDILLEMPLVFKCSPKCKGLCPGCGANLNHEKCTCKKNSAKKTDKKAETAPSPWDVLSELKLDEKPAKKTKKS